MYKYLILSIGLLLVPCCLKGQSDVKQPEMKVLPVNKDTFRLPGLTEEIKQVPQSVANPDYKFSAATNSYYVLPPSLTGYATYKLDSLRYDFYSVLFHSRHVWPGIMVMNTAGGTGAYRPEGLPVSLSGTMHALKYSNIGGRVYSDAIFRADISVQATPWLGFSAYGQYSALAAHNARMGSYFMPSFVPTSAFGVTSTVMFNKNFGVMGGVGREFNPHRGKWENTYMVSPVIDITRLFK